MTKLSICIPTYNSGIILLDNIKRMLSVNSDEFEIVVNDNCSEGGVYNKLLEIKDPRLHVYRNKKNEGFFENCYLALMRGEGAYIQLLVDRDYLDPEYLIEYIEDMQTAQADVIQTSYGEGDKQGKNPYQYIFLFSHPSCFAFSREKFHDLLEYKKDLELSYPWCLWAVKILEKGGRYVFYNRSMIKMVEESYYNIYKSPSELWKKTMGITNKNYEPYQVTMYCRMFQRFVKYTDTSNEHFAGMIICLFANSSKMCLINHYKRYRDKSYFIKRYNLTKTPFSLGQYICIQIWFNRWCQKVLRKKNKLSIKIRMYMNSITFRYIELMVLYYFWLNDTKVYQLIDAKVDARLKKI